MACQADPEARQAFFELKKGCHDLVVLDFDYTLFKGNSTELFLQYSTPVCIRNLVVKILKRVLARPWKLTRKLGRYKDEICCSVMILLTPWNLVRWRKHAPQLSYLVDDDMFALAVLDGRQVVVVTCGLKEIIRPILGYRSSRCTLISSEIHRPWGYVRKKGKVACLSKTVRGFPQKKVISISDSLEDKELLDATDGYLIAARYH